MNLALDGRYNKPEQRSALFMRFLETLRHLPGVVSAGAGSDLPLDHSESIGQVEVKGFGTSKDMIDSWWVTPRYFRALGMDLRAGRLFDDHDMKNVATSIIVNQAFVNAYMHGRDPLTCQVRYGYETDMAGRPWATVVGVVGNMKHSTLEEKPRPEYLQPYRPNFDAWNLHFAVKSRLAPQIILPFIRQGLRHLDPALGLDDVRTMQERIAEANARRSFQTAVLTTFAGMALLLAMIGVYGVMAYSVRQRTPEIGIRMALGASARQVSLMVARQGLSLVAAGLIIGTGIALVLARTITAWLYGVGPHDPLTFVLLPLPVLAAAGCACVIPALNASRVDPAIAIRNE
jgi:putative ABC transport system permease protein